MWSEPQERSYHTLEHDIVSKPVLLLPNVDEEFILRTDASDVGLGATLLQHRDGQSLRVPELYGGFWPYKVITSRWNTLKINIM